MTPLSSLCVANPCTLVVFWDQNWWWATNRCGGTGGARDLGGAGGECCCCKDPCGLAEPTAPGLMFRFKLNWDDGLFRWLGWLEASERPPTPLPPPLLPPPPPSKTELSDSSLVWTDDRSPFKSGLSLLEEASWAIGVDETAGIGEYGDVLICTGVMERCCCCWCCCCDCWWCCCSSETLKLISGPASGKTESGDARSEHPASRPSWPFPLPPPSLLPIPRRESPRGGPGLGLPSRLYSLVTLIWQPGELGMFVSGDRVEVSAMLSPGAGKFMGEGASVVGFPCGEPADPRDTGESEK